MSQTTAARATDPGVSPEMARNGFAKPLQAWRLLLRSTSASNEERGKPTPERDNAADHAHACGSPSRTTGTLTGTTPHLPSTAIASSKERATRHSTLRS